MLFLTEFEKNSYKNTLKKFINEKCVFRCNPDVQYAPGIPKGTLPGASPGKYFKWQLYLRNLTQNPEMVSLVTILFMEMMSDEKMIDDDFQFCGLETSSIPLISNIQTRMDVYYEKHVNYFSVRKERKKYGLFNFVDGIPNKNKFIIVDDIINSGSSIRRILETNLFEFDLEPFNQAFFIVNFRKQTGFMPFNGTTIKLNFLFTLDDLDLKYDPEKYWIPFDCDKSFNKRPDYR